MMLEITELYVLMPDTEIGLLGSSSKVAVTLKTKNLHTHFLANFSVDFDEVSYGATSSQFCRSSCEICFAQ